MKSIEIAQPVRSFRPLSEEVYDVLRSAILSGRLPAGARIVEADVARQMAISRSPVREAVRKLEHEGLVEYVPRHGTIVVVSRVKTRPTPTPFVRTSRRMRRDSRRPEQLRRIWRGSRN